ncbi:hypothetical protein [Mesorhizobium sp. CA16]|uniref:hypothetical protein n=1 Tax=Mesorhizobium sp. CA16 TaxID=588496 RepID=UPI001CCFBCAC|nr:hypothetical protein [Mesorhizobium sp. CA16]MBZ9914397.1 hypothetical protein [Mesorhizobium sp. CA16]
MGGLALRATIGQTMDQVLDKACHASGRKAFHHPAVSSYGRNGARLGEVPITMRCCRHENLQRAEETKVGSHVVRDGWTEGVQGALARPRPVNRRAAVLG